MNTIYIYLYPTKNYYIIVYNKKMYCLRSKVSLLD